jgi:hypothetical protein
MDRGESNGIRWLGWTLLHAAFLTLALAMLAHDMPGWLNSLAVLAALLTFALPLVIGIFFPEDNWRLGPVLSMGVALVLVLAIPATDPPEQTGIGLVTRKDQFIFLLLWGGWLFLTVLGLLYTGLAIVGIRSGRSRLARKNWDRDVGFQNMFSSDHSTQSD